jgi:hypothetical protein
VPDRRTGEAGHRPHAERGGGARGVLQLARGALAHTFRVAVAPHVRGQDGLVARIHKIAHRLADQVVADREALQAVLGQQRALVEQVLLRRERLLHIEMVAPARELEPVVAHAFGERREFGQRQVGPLAGEERDGASHGRGLLEKAACSVRTASRGSRSPSPSPS